MTLKLEAAEAAYSEIERLWFLARLSIRVQPSFLVKSQRVKDHISAVKLASKNRRNLCCALGSCLLFELKPHMSHVCDHVPVL